MNNTIKLAVAAALLAGASSANAGIIIPAGDWTLDIGGNVNTFYTHSTVKGAAPSVTNITTGLLPNFLSVSGKTRQNDLDVGFTISIQPGSADAQALTLGTQNNRQAFLTFGDASWGSIKLGKDLGIYASDAILSDMTLLGVGAGATGIGNTTLGRIGYGYQYADWKSQVAYSSPNWNGFSFTAGVTQPWSPTGQTQKDPAFEGKASYAWTGDFAGKVWVSGISQKVQAGAVSKTADAWDIGANVNAMGFGLTGYYGEGKGTGTLGQMNDATVNLKNNDWYVQGTYTLPGVGTKLGVSYGESSIDNPGFKDSQKDMWTVGAYHPLTKHLNLVAEYSQADQEVASVKTSEINTISLGAILFF
jgi:predicted porin